MIGLIGVGKRYGRGPWVLRGVDLDVGRAELVVLLGVNGSGKSTLMRVLAGIVAPTEGEVGGRGTVGFVPERFPAGLKLSARDYLRHQAAIRGASGSGTQLLERLGFAGDPDRPMAELSKGNAQRVALAQAFVARPALLVLDEPFAGLDEHSRAELCSMIDTAVADGASAVVTDHTGTRSRLAATRTIAVADGSVRVVDTASSGTGAVVLACPPDLHAEVVSLPGVLQSSQGPLVRLEVLGAEVDSVLTAALALGCSVHEVRRTEHAA
ncbi:ATP-binding cassette domain-containing protein [Allokutzneria albata]|uniref:ABC-type multidrug transport system, ATPase component n=1 Tax=Allokutzneria albata TaxID=211114 RepID=A0A1G9VBB4_ALLAB|nr:ABC transporter ATP-binding protein [Allokutzneria albata]SDM69347.1 ABC-type multidrug transport system, ATPase component [Allokutzneria albata]